MNQVHDDKSAAKKARANELELALQVLKTEAQAVLNLQITESFHAAVDLILARCGHGEELSNVSDAPLVATSSGSLVISGLGKSGLIGAKLSATFASTGTPSHFLHPAEAVHGDLGRIRRQDVVLLLSYGGNTEEVVSLATLLRQDAVPTIAMVSKLDCDLARIATIVLLVGDVTEACPLNLAPTASTTAMLALGDALAMCVSQRREFNVEDFKRFHPGGSLGRQLMPVVEAMRFKVGLNLPLSTKGMTVEQAFASAEQKAVDGRRAGALLVVDEHGKLAGIFTDGDLRRLLIRHGAGAMLKPIGEAMTQRPRRLTESSRVKDAVQMVRQFRIDEIPVVDGNDVPLGLIDVQDLVALKVIEG